MSLQQSSLQPVPVMDWEKLPLQLRNNWIIYTTLRSKACVTFASTYADACASFQEEKAWVAAFDLAALAWEEANPVDKQWSSGKWPEGASIYLGEVATDRALQIMNQN